MPNQTITFRSPLHFLTTKASATVGCISNPPLKKRGKTRIEVSRNREISLFFPRIRRNMLSTNNLTHFDNSAINNKESSKKPHPEQFNLAEGKPCLCGLPCSAEMFLNNDIGQPRLSFFRANGQEDNRRLTGINMNAARRMLAFDFIIRSLASHIAKNVGKIRIRQR